MHVSAIWRWAATIFCWWNFRTSAPDWLSRACFKSVTSKKSFSFSELDFLFEIGVFDGNLVKLSIWFIISDSIILKIFIFIYLGQKLLIYARAHFRMTVCQKASETEISTLYCYWSFLYIIYMIKMKSGWFLWHKVINVCCCIECGLLLIIKFKKMLRKKIAIALGVKKKNNHYHSGRFVKGTFDYL